MAMEALDCPTVYPVHPRNHERVKRLDAEYKFRNLIFCTPVGYLMSVYLTNHAEKIVTDSGGLQREAFFAEKQCVTVFDYVGWPETMIDNRNQLAKPDKEDILRKLEAKQTVRADEKPFGDGKSGEKIAAIIVDYFEGIDKV